jgi:hypothetical protein
MLEHFSRQHTALPLSLTHTHIHTHRSMDRMGRQHRIGLNLRVRCLYQQV